MLRTDVVEPHDLLTELRSRTANSHRRLERDLDLLHEPPERARFIRLLERFYGFHAVWEPRVARMLAKERPFLTPRQRTDRAARDLASLGHSPRQIARLPLCLAAARVVRSPEAAIGSLYVLEGSTLGGQIVSRGLAGAAWLPTDGLGYFDPYGVATGTMWRQFRIWAETVSTTSGTPAIIAGAVATFDTLHDWLTATMPQS